MEWKTWSPLSGREQPAEVQQGNPNRTTPSLLMTMSIEAYGTTARDIAIQWGHFLVEGSPTTTVTRQRILEAVIEALHLEGGKLTKIEGPVEGV
ncbi:MAG: hypothetical protein ACRDRI_26635 [Pseudonocardiaceae bacterium]